MRRSSVCILNAMYDIIKIYNKNINKKINNNRVVHKYVILNGNTIIYSATGYRIVVSVPRLNTQVSDYCKHDLRECNVFFKMKKMLHYNRNQTF